MKISRAILSLIFLLPGSCWALDDTVIAKIQFSVHMSPAAEAKCREQKRSVVASVDYDADFGNGGDPQTIVHEEYLQFPCDGGTLTALPVNFSMLLKDKENGGKAHFSALGFDVYTPSINGQYNLIECEISPGGIFAGDYNSPSQINENAECKLIGE